MSTAQYQYDCRPSGCDYFEWPELPADLVLEPAGGKR